MSQRPDDLVSLTTVASEFEAGVVVAALREEGIDARQNLSGMQGILGSGAGSIISPVQVLVPRADLERARTALENRREESVDIDWSEVDVGEGESIDKERRSAHQMRNVIIIVIALAIAIYFLLLAVKSPPGSGPF